MVENYKKIYILLKFHIIFKMQRIIVFWASLLRTLVKLRNVDFLKIVIWNHFLILI